MARVDGRLAQRLEHPAYTSISAWTRYKPIQLSPIKPPRILQAFRLPLYAFTPSSCTIHAQSLRCPLNCHKNFGHSLRFYFNVFASPSKGWGLGKGTAFESPSPDSPVEARSSFSWFPSFTINCKVAPREPVECPRSLCCANSSGGR